MPGLICLLLMFCWLANCCFRVCSVCCLDYRGARPREQPAPGCALFVVCSTRCFLWLIACCLLMFAVALTTAACSLFVVCCIKLSVDDLFLSSAGVY